LPPLSSSLIASGEDWLNSAATFMSISAQKRGLSDVFQILCQSAAA
jgi:hypothetical protein